MLRFRPMSDEEFAAFHAALVRDYADDIARNYRVAPEEALARSRAQTGDLSQQRADPQHLFLTIALEQSGQAVGALWCQLKPERSYAFILDFVLDPAFRGQGYGRRSLELLDRTLAARGVRQIGLHVFGDNARAQALYRELGYYVTGLNMQKDLDPD
jgi:ribosomal protein S18 acetylase RimI-like enzyme